MMSFSIGGASCSKALGTHIHIHVAFNSLLRNMICLFSFKYRVSLSSKVCPQFVPHLLFFEINPPSHLGK